MRPWLLLIAFVLVLLGVVWVGQGVGLIGGSFMSGSSMWAVIGTVLLVVGVAIAVREWATRGRRRS